MLLIFNCKSIYGTEIPFMAHDIKSLGHRLAVLGGPSDMAGGYMIRAQAALRCDAAVTSDEEHTGFRMTAMSEVMTEFEEPKTLVISDDARDLAAADMLGVPTVSPFDFSLDHLGET
jgi:hypothetical protein